jgi:sugar lactone lactonase YvrE
MFNLIYGVAVDGGGNLLITDTGSNRIRRVASSTGIITTVAGGGYAPGVSNIYVSVSLPRGVVVSGNKVYVTDTARHNIYVLNKNTGVVSETYGSSSSGTTATAGLLSFNQPYRIAVDSTGNIFVADTVSNRIRRINFPAGTTTTIAGGGGISDTSSGSATSKFLNRPNGVAVYGSIVYFTNTNANTVCKVESGNISNLPGSYSAPEGIAVDSYGNVYIANSGLNKISIVATDNSITNITLPSGGYPRGVAVDIAGNIYVADGGNNWILRLKTDSSSGVVQLVSTTIMAIGLNNPMDVSVDTDGTLYVADFGNNKIMKVVTTFS